jgi:hypothetical protein
VPKQLHLRLNSDLPTIIDVQDDEAVQVHLETHPKDRDGERDPTLSVSGLRWRGGRHFHLTWSQQSIPLGSTLRLDYLVDDKPASGLSKDVEYIAPAPTCRFCDRAAADIGLLIKRRHIYFICDACVDECKVLVDEWRATRDARRSAQPLGSMQTRTPLRFSILLGLWVGGTTSLFRLFVGLFGAGTPDRPWWLPVAGSIFDGIVESIIVLVAALLGASLARASSIRVSSRQLMIVAGAVAALGLSLNSVLPSLADHCHRTESCNPYSWWLMSWSYSWWLVLLAAALSTTYVLGRRSAQDSKHAA